jgi:hypothetical protein
MTHEPDGPAGPARPYRVDRPAGAAEGMGARHSGRAFVTAAVVTILLIGGGLSLAFHHWRAGYRARADFGRSAVASAVVPLAEQVPPGVPPTQWRRAVDQTRALLVEVTASGRLDRPQMQALRDDLARRVAGARPETARAELARIWDEMEAKTLLRDATRRPELLKEGH